MTTRLTCPRPCPVPTDLNAFWKEIRSYKHYMIIGSELRNHGIQIFDMKKVGTCRPLLCRRIH
jgi:hypothetical protein